MLSLKSLKTLFAFVLLGIVAAWTGCSDSAPVASRPVGKATCSLCEFLGDDAYTATDGLPAPESPDTTQTDADADSTQTEADADSTQAATVEFADANLERAVREALDRPQGTLTPADLAALTELDASYKNIESVAGLEHATALTTLYLRGNAITDVQPLASLINLQTLSLWGNKVADASPLASLIRLRKLDMWGNAITDVQPLARLTNLQWLQLGDNEIADVSPLASLTNLQWLGVMENALSQHAANQQLAASMASGLRVVAVIEKYPRVETVQVYPEEPEPTGPQEPIRELIALYWTDYGTGRIHRADPADPDNVDTLAFIPGSNPSGIALDLANRKVYWTDLTGNKIHRVDLDGENANVDTLIKTGLDWPSGIALDLESENKKMYWAETGGNRIRRADLSGDNMETLGTMRLADPSGIALDVEGGKMYFTDQGWNNIHRADLDGRNDEILVTLEGVTEGSTLRTMFRPNELFRPGRIALDLWSRKMYWTDRGNSSVLNSIKIQRADLDGRNVETLVSNRGLIDPFGIALGPPDMAGEKKMYWADYSTRKIQYANLDGSGVTDLIYMGLTTPSTIALEIR